MLSFLLSASLYMGSLFADPLLPPSSSGSPTTLIYDHYQKLTDTTKAPYPQLHKCKDGGEVYAASYLTTKEHLLWETFEELNMHGQLTCERASFMMHRSKANPAWNIPGAPIQALDLFDYSVVHLSAYERVLKKFKKNLPKVHSTIPVAEKLQVTKSLLRQPSYKQYLAEHSISNAPELNRTLAIMPILITSMGMGHSSLRNRIIYLKTCFWSLYPIIPNIVVTVASVQEKLFLEEKVRLPFYEIVVIDFYNRTDALPAGSVIEAQKRFRSGRWNFDYLFYTESDQILMIRNARNLFDYLKEFPMRMLIPHRLQPYPGELLTKVFKKTLKKHTGPLDWMNSSCCMERTNCLGDRSSWVHISNSKVAVVKVFNLYVALGNSNFLQQHFRSCVLTENAKVQLCP